MKRAPKNVLVDNVAVQRRIAGDHDLDLTPEERKKVIRLLHGRGMTDVEITEVSGFLRDTVTTTRRRMGLTPNPDLTRHSNYGLAPHVRTRKNAREKASA
jgi:hypothetical protein